MSKMLKSKMDMQNKLEEEALEKALKLVDYSLLLKKEGKEEESQKIFEELRTLIGDFIKTIKDEVEEKKVEKVSITFSQEGEILAEGNKVRLGVIRADEKEKYLALEYAHSVMKNMFKKEEFLESLWQEFTSENAIVCSIYEKISGDYVGYCSIKDVSKPEWELGIELRTEECNKGYGSEALSLFTNAIHKLTNRQVFRARVEIDNHASQRMLKKLGATPDGISEFLIHGKEIERFQEEHKDMITDEIRRVAEDFCMEAEDILGYVLEYRLVIKNL